MKFAHEDKTYLDRRRAVSTETGPVELWSVIDHWPLYAGIANLARFVAIGDLLRSTLHVPGHVAEFGSWRGANLMYMAKLLRIFDPHGSKLCHCFDSFEGLTNFSAEDGSASKSAGDYRGNLAELERMIGLYGLQDEIEIHVGLIEDTLPKLLKDNAALTFSFVYCDTDLYQSTHDILELVHPRIMTGGLIVFDEWNDERWQGEGVAANEFLAKHGDRYEACTVQSSRQPTLAIRKTRFGD